MGSKKHRREHALERIADGEDAATVDHDDEHTLTAEDAYQTDAAHPEKMKGTVELRITNHVTLKATARATPAGLVGAAVLLSAVLIPITWAKRAR